eukprot:COSAG03_NODE_2212_length_3003_cov_4.915289_3_plen_254_part_00
MTAALEQTLRVATCSAKQACRTYARARARAHTHTCTHRRRHTHTHTDTHRHTHTHTHTDTHTHTHTHTEIVRRGTLHQLAEHALLHRASIPPERFQRLHRLFQRRKGALVRPTVLRRERHRPLDRDKRAVRVPPFWRDAVLPTLPRTLAHRPRPRSTVDRAAGVKLEDEGSQSFCSAESRESSQSGHCHISGHFVLEACSRKFETAFPAARRLHAHCADPMLPEEAVVTRPGWQLATSTGEARTRLSNLGLGG